MPQPLNCKKTPGKEAREICTAGGLLGCFFLCLQHCRPSMYGPQSTEMPSGTGTAQNPRGNSQDKQMPLTKMPRRQSAMGTQATLVREAAAY